MSTTDDTAGMVRVTVSAKAVHNAVRNIMTHEMSLDPVKVKDEVAAKAEEIIRDKVIGYLDGHGYGRANLSERVTRAVSHYEGKIETMVREAVGREVRTFLEREVKLAIEALVKNTEVKVGWGVSGTTVKISPQEPK